MSGLGVIGELTAIITVKDAITKSLKSWEPIRLHIRGKTDITLPYGRLMQYQSVSSEILTDGIPT